MSFYWRLQFARNSKNISEAQKKVFEKILRQSSQTVYGQISGLKEVKTYEQFRSNVPIADYEDLLPFIDQQLTAQDILFPGPSIFCEKTSGSVTEEKKIPFSRGLLRSFAKMFLIWSGDSLIHLKTLRTGKTFITVSPASQGDENQNMATDMDYLPKWLQFFVRSFVVDLSFAKTLRNPDHYKKYVSYLLLANRDLEIISIWSPTYLLSLLNYIEDRKADFLSLPKTNSFRKKLSSETRLALQKDKLDWQDIWPQLRLISCWADGEAKEQALQLWQKLSFTTIQPKGLLATECPVTIPFGPLAQMLPFVSDIFIELEDDQGSVVRLADANLHQPYRLIVSHPEGFLRYRLGDVVVPMRANASQSLELRFVGRGELVSDMVGEKLNLAFLKQMVQARDISLPVDCLIFPVKLRNDTFQYTCLMGGVGSDAESIEENLQKSYHYRVARHQGQLGPLTTLPCSDPHTLYLDYCQDTGKNVGGVKSQLLVNKPISEENFKKYFKDKSNSLEREENSKNI